MAQDTNKVKSGVETVSSKNAAGISEYVLSSWEGDSGVQKTLEEFISIPNQSPQFDPDYNTNGEQEKACDLLVDWVTAQQVTGLTMRVFKHGVEVPYATSAVQEDEAKADKNSEDGRTPFIFIEIAASDPSQYTHTILMYGHFDKQPPMTEEWNPDLGGPTTPVVVDGKLYGRGGCDDGYAIFACIDCIKALQSQSMDYPRIVILEEGSEESGSPDLDYYRNLLTDDIGNVDYVVCLDSGSLNYDQLFLTVSLRGFMVADMSTAVITDSIHSGSSGFIRDSFHITRKLLDRVDDVNDEEYGGKMMDGLQVDIPEKHVQYAEAIVASLGDVLVNDYPLIEGCDPQISPDKENALRELLLNKTWRSQLAITGIKDMPNTWEDAGNVLRKNTNTRMSIRLAPTLDPTIAYTRLHEALTEAPIPYNAQLEVTYETGAEGFVSPDLYEWLETALQESSHTYFGADKDCLFYGEGGTIPLMGQLQELFPSAQFIVTGCLGPNSNAHGPNESLDIAFCQKLTMCMAYVTNLIALNHTTNVVAADVAKTGGKASTIVEKGLSKNKAAVQMKSSPKITNFMD